ncbi:MAG: CatB-related O-acetyltransferase [Actinobacteria bacterium]|nr:CatB-related O-acetyltransferase [Actinomycetota bacterium]
MGNNPRAVTTGRAARRIKDSAQRVSAKLIETALRQERFRRYHAAIRSGALVQGRSSYGVPEIFEYAGSEQKIYIGSFTSISEGVKIVTGGVHPLDWVGTYPFRIKWDLPGAFEDGMPCSKGDVVIGSDVWIATDVLILSGVSIGDGAVVGAGSVVSSNVPPYAIVAGNPARTIRMRFTHDQVEKLLQIQWWNWPEEDVKDAVELLSSSQVDAFIEKAGQRN